MDKPYNEVTATVERLRVWTRIRAENGARQSFFLVSPTHTITLLDADIERVCVALETEQNIVSEYAKLLRQERRTVALLRAQLNAKPEAPDAGA